MILSILIVFAAAGLQLLPSAPVSAAPSSRPVLNASDVIAAINEYRAQYGLPAYQTNSNLMAAAQAQSDYQASIGDVTHSGPGGTRPSDRVYATGYGSGNSVWVSEIIFGGINATVADAVGWWKTSAIHNDTMLSPRYVEIGAGVSTAGGMVYYTAVTGYVTGSPAPEVDQEAAAEAPVEEVPLVIPVVPAEPREDGAIVHIVRTGQSLWNIAAVYDVPMEKILDLNNLTENATLQVGQEVLVAEASGAVTPSPGEPPETDRVTPGTTPSLTPTIEIASSTASPTPQEVVSAEPAPTAIPISPVQAGPDVGMFLSAGVVVLVLAFVGLSFTRVDPEIRSEE